MEYSTHVSLTTVAQTIKGAINELVTSIGNKIAKTTNITAIDDTGIADGEIIVANLTAKKLETSNVLIGDVRLKNNLIAEYTVDVAYPSGAPVADAGTDTITLVGHGFLDNQCIEITAGTGAIPGGLTAINSSKFTQVHGKFYGYVMNKTNDTFQVYSTLGTVTAIDITSAGTAGWLVRLAGLTTVNFTGLSLANIGDSYSVSIVGTMIASTTGSLYVTSILNGYGASLVYFMPHTDQSFWGAALLYLSTPIVSASKYTSMSMKVDYIKVGTEEIAINSGWGGIRTNDFATNTLVSMANLTGFARYSSFTTVTTIRIQTTCLMLNGTKLLLAKEN